MSPLIIAKNCCHAWQMIPGYLGERWVFYSFPVCVTDFRPLKTSSNLVKIEVINLFDLIYLEMIKKIVVVRKGN